jgi:hypothetical protein
MEELTNAYNKAKEVLQGVTSLDDFEKNKDTIKQTVLDGLKAALGALQEMKDSGASQMEIMMAFEMIKKVYTSKGDELDIEFKRIRKLPDADDPGLMFQGELMGYSSPITNNMKLLWMEMK